MLNRSGLNHLGVDIFLRSGFSIVVFSVVLFLRDALVLSIKSIKHIEEAALPKLHVKSEKSENGLQLYTL